MDDNRMKAVLFKDDKETKELINAIVVEVKKSLNYNILESPKPTGLNPRPIL